MSSPRSLTLPFRPPFLAGPLLRFLGDRAIPGVEEVRGSTFRRSVATPHGPAVLALTPGPETIRLDVTGADPRSVPALVRTAGALFDLDGRPDAVVRALGPDPVLGAIARAHAGIRVPGAADGFELVVRAVVGQQVSVRAARTMLGRVADRFGAPLETGDEGVRTLFPGPDGLADAPLEELGVTSRRASAIRRVAAMVARGELDLTGSGDADETVRALLGVDGIGPWTGAYVRMRALGDPDAFLTGDLGLRRAAERLGLDPAPRAMLERAEAWRPFRAYAAMLLWQAGPERAVAD